MNPSRYHTQPLASDGRALHAAFDKCLDLVRARGSAEMAVALRSKADLAGAVTRVLGADAVRVLDRDNTHMRKGLALHLLTVKVQRRRMQGPVWAVFLNPTLLDQVVAPAGITDVVVVPLQADDLVAYLARYPASVAIDVSDRQDAGPTA